MTNLAVRSAVSADAASLLDLIRQHAAFEQTAASVDEDGLARVLDARQSPARLFVAEESGRLAGYAALTFDFKLWTASRFAHLDCLFVGADARGRGIGTLLFDCACLVAAEVGAQTIEWQTPSWNEDAIRFYEREGGSGQLKMRFKKILPQLTQKP